MRSWSPILRCGRFADSSVALARGAAATGSCSGEPVETIPYEDVAPGAAGAWKDSGGLLAQFEGRFLIDLARSERREAERAASGIGSTSGTSGESVPCVTGAQIITR